MRMQSIIRAIYPTQCVACDAPTEDDFGLCGACWRETQFISGTICGKCGTSLPGDSQADDLLCDDCLTIARPWDRGRSVLAYSGVGRKLVLSLKHGDRTDLAQPAARWMARVAAPLLAEDTLSGAITANPKRKALIAGGHILLVDDVMTSGATLAASAEACFVAGAREVNVLTLARVVKDD